VVVAGGTGSTARKLVRSNGTRIVFVAPEPKVPFGRSAQPKKNSEGAA
jgi:hypothetical protein